MALTDPVKRLGEWFADIAMEYVPDPYVLVILLTFIAAIGALLVGTSPTGVMDAWFGGVWTLLVFMAQFALTLMVGDAIAKSPAVSRLLRRIAGLPNSQFSAVALTSFVAMLAGLISWAIGLIVGAVIARQVAFRGKERGLKLHYPLLIAAGYTALMIWHSGITTSSGLIMADPAAIPATFPEYAQEGIPLGETIGSLVNIVTVVLLLAVIPVVMGSLHPKGGEEITEMPDNVYDEIATSLQTKDDDAPDSGVAADGGVATETNRTPADRLNDSRVLGLIIALFPAYYFVSDVIQSGLGAINLNTINAFFIFCAIVLWVTPKRIVTQMDKSVKNVAGILFQFPFYAGIAGLLTGTALAAAIAGFFADIATPLTWPVLGLISAGIVNVFVPSGGGQWVAQGPILLETTRELGMPLYTAVVIEMMGDQLTNMIQPFWAVPALALAQLRARDILGYTTVAMVAGFIIMAITMTLFLGMGIGA
ncbi:short-chain fatty acid transporter [Haloprofundus salinisoli]|uniref:short-chain fatty acid transporter n=1 Tax=Haloprofundus salinisoli TaxID=2876193 RepID=UPI001CCC5288|nr:TIGR00366 family protein [Haloprofundus salinisoli]